MTRAYYGVSVPEWPVPDILKGLVMPGLQLTPLEGGSRSRTPLEDIEPTVIDTVEEAYVFSQSNPDARLESPPFKSKEEAEDFLADMRAYAYHRKDTKGRLIVTGNLAKTPPVIRFRVSEFVAPAE